MPSEKQTLRYAEIDYGSGLARIWGAFKKKDAADAFERRASDMFGIRKSIMEVKVLKVEKVDSLPKPWDAMNGAAFVLSHNCGGPGWVFNDLAVWNSNGEKIKSEWD